MGKRIMPGRPPDKVGSWKVEESLESARKERSVIQYWVVVSDICIEEDEQGAPPITLEKHSI